MERSSEKIAARDTNLKREIRGRQKFDYDNGNAYFAGTEGGGDSARSTGSGIALRSLNSDGRRSSTWRRARDK